MSANEPARRGRALGIDLGSRRIGVALTDEARTMSLPHATVDRSGDRARDRQALVELALEAGATVVVVGHPRSLDGRVGPAARAVESEAAALADALVPHGIALELFDERFTTVTAERELAAAGMRGARRRGVVDRSAAAVLLSSWLDAAGRPGGGEERG